MFTDPNDSTWRLVHYDGRNVTREDRVYSRKGVGPYQVVWAERVGQTERGYVHVRFESEDDSDAGRMACSALGMFWTNLSVVELLLRGIKE